MVLSFKLLQMENAKFKKIFEQGNSRFAEVSRNICMHPYIVTQHMHSYEIYFTIFKIIITYSFLLFLRQSTGCFKRMWIKYHNINVNNHIR